MPMGSRPTTSPEVRLDEQRYRVGRDRFDLSRGALELVVREDRRALEGQLAVKLDPRPASAVLVADLDGDRTGDAVGAQQDHVERVTPLPGEPLCRVVAGPDVVGRQRVDTTRVGDEVAGGHLGPRADAHAVWLRHGSVAVEQCRGRLAVGPHTLLERALELGVVRLTYEAAGLVVERRVEEEPVVLDLEVAVLLADATFAESQQLLAFGKRAHGHGPFFESDRHMRGAGPRPELERSGYGVSRTGRAASKRSVYRDARL